MRKQIIFGLIMLNVIEYLIHTSWGIPQEVAVGVHTYISLIYLGIAIIFKADEESSVFVSGGEADD